MFNMFVLNAEVIFINVVSTESQTLYNTRSASKIMTGLFLSEVSHSFSKSSYVLHTISKIRL